MTKYKEYKEPSSITDDDIIFEYDKENSDNNFDVWTWEECFEWMIKILKYKYSEHYTVVAKLFTRNEEDWTMDGCAELTSSIPETYEEAVKVAYKLWKMCLDYKVPSWKE